MACTLDAAISIAVVNETEPQLQKYYVIVNPKAANYSRRLIDGGLPHLVRQGVSTAEIAYFSDDAQLRKTIQGALGDGFRAFVVVGGDGMVSLVASYLHGKGAAIGIVPAGTTNMISQVLGMPVRPLDAFRLLAGATARRNIDGLQIGGRLFFMNASVGLSSYTIQQTRQEAKSFLKVFAYVFAVLRGLTRTRRIVFGLEIDGIRREVTALELFVANIGSLLAPRYTLADSSPDDGRFEVCALHNGGLEQLPNALLDIFLRKRKRYIDCITTAHTITVSCGEPLPVQADGDLVGSTPVTIRIVPHAATFMVPDGTATA